ncbi:immunoglobulin superfamily member 11-like [Acanthopagrus schlegelii]
MELLPLVCLCLLSCSGDAVRVVVEQDSDAVLPCLIRTKENITGELLVWKKDDQKEVFTHDTSDKFPNRDQDDQFKGRVSVFQDQLQNGNASIKITRTKMADSGNYSCIFPHHQSQPSIIELVVDRVLKDRTGENIPGAAPEPCIRTLAESNLWSLLECEAHGDPLPTLEWEDSDNNTAEEPQISDRGGRSYITVNVTVTKTGNYRCVATQETLSHQIAAVTSVQIQGSNTGAIVGGIVCGAALIIIVLVLVIIRLDRKLRNKKKSDAVELNPTDQNNRITEPLKQPDP